MKLPRTPGALDIQDADLRTVSGDLVRIHPTGGTHSLPWNVFRHWGPLPMRFEPHPDGIPRHHEDRSVSYTSGDLDTALAEVFQNGRSIVPDVPAAPYLTIWTPTRDLRLLDIAGSWPIRNEAPHALNTGPHAVCRVWARAIAQHRQRVDGIRYDSAMTGAPAMALFRPAANSQPAAPRSSLPLTHPGLRTVLERAATRIGYDLA